MPAALRSAASLGYPGLVERLGWIGALCSLLVACYGGPGSSADTDAASATDGTESGSNGTDASVSGPGSTASASGTSSGSATSPDSETSPGSATSPTSDTSNDTSGASDSSTGGSSESATDGGSGETTSGSGSTGGSSVSDCSAQELELIDLVNAYRGENGLAPIPASPSLCIVGHTHAEDLAINAPHAEANCNLHSWSDAGDWSPCCYTPDHAQAQCMWDKPAELTTYPGYGYENAAGGGGAITPQTALDLWKNSPGHNAVILNQGTWANLTWGALGAGIYEGYAVLWFGEEADPLQ